ncbi:hypothetical protein KXV63_005602 [Aspergillus fumigatus]|nr:hypothetical protein KXV63_005602 [Aspergillus fumigatus]
MQSMSHFSFSVSSFDFITSKHFFDDPNHLVQTALHSLTLTNPSLAFDSKHKVIFRRPDASRKPKVAIISGGGSGHEPAFAGYVGHGLMDASVAGSIFASPSAEQIRHAAMNCVDNEKGVLIIPMNYTGDVLNFGMAAEKSRAAGIKTEFFAINDDAGVGRKKGGKVGRRGIGGGILILKIVGALAETGASLEDVYRVAQLANANLASVGSSLEHVHIPGRGVPEDVIPDGEVEVGMGIHNEPGSHRMKFSLPEVIKTMLLQILDHNDPDRAFLTYQPGDQFVLLINNLGGVSTLELSGITDEVYRQLTKDFHIKPVRIIQGTFLTSLNGLGFSVSLLKLADTGLGPGKSMLELLDAPAEAVGWSAPIRTSTWEAHQSDAPVQVKSTKLAEDQPSNIKQAVLSLLEDPSSGLTDDAVTAVNRIVTVVENTMDGTSGAIYSIFLNALAHGLRAQDQGTPTPATVEVWANALKYSITALGKYTPAQPGDRTLIDALVPFCNTLVAAKDVHAAAKAAQDGTEATKSMKASLGRSVYVGGEAEWVGKVPDPGAYGLSELLTGLAEAL